MNNETLPWVLTMAIVLRFYFGQCALQEGSVQWSVWIAWAGVTDRDRGLCLSMSASWPLQQSHPVYAKGDMPVRALIALGRPTCIHTSHLLTPPSLFRAVCPSVFALSLSPWLLLSDVVKSVWIVRNVCLVLLGYFYCMLTLSWCWSLGARSLWVSLFSPKLGFG